MLLVNRENGVLTVTTGDAPMYCKTLVHFNITASVSTIVKEIVKGNRVQRQAVSACAVY